ncbi:nitroreductase [Limosilactobacillus avium]|uniref:nitroreductase n=1 Tax=Limosilactobacillus avium TaxID=2991831 RepID=UPI0024B8C211|nr:nitroreductase [Limosilactobacillus avium]
MEFEQALKNRHSVRQFTDQQVPLNDIRQIIKNVQLAPSWVNSQPYHVHLVVGESLERVRHEQFELEQKGIKGHSDIPVMSRKKWSKQAQANMAEWTQGLGEAAGKMGPAAAKLYNAQAVIYLTLPKGYSAWSLYDLGAFGNDIVLAASNLGISSMTAYQFVKYPDMLRQQLAIPDDEDIIIGIGLGYRDDKAEVNTISSKRMDLEKILFLHQ